MNKQQTTKIGIFLIGFMLISIVSAHFVSDPSHCTSFSESICDADEQISCDGGGYFCEPHPGDIYGDIYCTVGNPDIYSCPTGCDTSTGECFGGNPDCVNGYERCGLGYLADPEGDIYKCVDSQWKLIEVCGSKPCKESSYNNAECEETRYYCTSTLDCFWSTTKNSNCYNTLEECRTHLGSSSSSSSSSSGGGGGEISKTFLIIGGAIFLIGLLLNLKGGKKRNGK